MAKQQLASQPEEILQLPLERTRATWVKDVVRLRENVEETQERRVDRSAHNIFKYGYNPATHARLRRVLHSCSKGQSEQSLALAIPAFRFDEERDFLRRFFSTEPELKRELENWMAALSQLHG